ncbi:hypothetical protein Kirov_253 [Bacillus phage Kirov]|uniref:Uncharacterized protein n=1 Tax=Bacillus phage Kirov TaxID=2783539 RepID=A0A7U3NK14_9CAUD|nr:hypothetical protein PQE67_gp051 [Bacillus phage Kirov]QOV08452.1 hypothetical protein Kirov_253 [Bacillus phage Kirov]
MEKLENKVHMSIKELKSKLQKAKNVNDLTVRIYHYDEDNVEGFIVEVVSNFMTDDDTYYDLNTYGTVQEAKKRAEAVRKNLKANYEVASGEIEVYQV